MDRERWAVVASLGVASQGDAPRTKAKVFYGSGRIGCSVPGCASHRSAAPTKAKVFYAAHRMARQRLPKQRFLLGGRIGCSAQGAAAQGTADQSKGFLWIGKDRMSLPRIAGRCRAYQSKGFLWIGKDRMFGATQCDAGHGAAAQGQAKQRFLLEHDHP